MKMEIGFPSDADSAMHLDGVARHSVIGLGRRDPRSSGVKAEIGLAGTGGRVNGVGAREFDKHIIFGDAVLDRLERADRRSEEHTSELQSLMRISYAVFCLQKKKKRTYKQETREERN